MKRQPLKLEYKRKPRYHVYRSTNPKLPFFLWERITRKPLEDEIFTDVYHGADKHKVFYYKFRDVDQWGNEGEPYDPPGKQSWVRNGKEIERTPATTIIGIHVYRSIDKTLPLEEWERITDEPETEERCTFQCVPGVMNYFYARYVFEDGHEGARSDVMEIMPKP